MTFKEFIEKIGININKVSEISKDSPLDMSEEITIGDCIKGYKALSASINILMDEISWHEGTPKEPGWYICEENEPTFNRLYEIDYWEGYRWSYFFKDQHARWRKIREG